MHNYDEFVRSFYCLPLVGEEVRRAVVGQEVSKRVNRVHQANKEIIYIDVTDTDACQILTGIQRVVRQIVLSFEKRRVAIELVRYDFDTGGFVVLSEAEKVIFHDLLSGSKAGKQFSKLNLNFHDAFYKFARSVGRFLTGLFHSLEKTGYFSVLMIALEASKPPMVRKIRSKRKKKYELIPLIPVKGMQILLPELIYEAGRAEQYISMEKFYDVKINVILYDLIPLYHPEMVQVAKEFLDYMRVVRIATKIIAISEYSADQVTAYLRGWNRERAGRTPSVETIYLPFVKRDMTRTDLKYEKPTFIFVSTIEPRKNHLRLILAANKIKSEGYEFEVICVGNVGGIGEITRAFIADLLAKGAPVRFLSNVGDEQLKEILNRSWCAIYPSLVEGFGLPVIEADQYDLPVIVSNNSAMRDVAANFVKCYFLIEPESVDSIAEGMKSFLDNSTADFQTNIQVGCLPESWDAYAGLVHKSIIQ